MGQIRKHEDASLENNIRYACDGNFQAIIYDDFSGGPLEVTYLGYCWWVTTPGQKLQPLENYFEGEDIGFKFLCGADGRVGAVALAKMLGKALEEPEDDVETVLRNRVQALKRLGATLCVSSEPLVLELEVFENKKETMRQGKYSMWCHLADDFSEMVFDSDNFDSKQHAEEWAFLFFDFLKSLGIDIKIV